MRSRNGAHPSRETATSATVGHRRVGVQRVQRLEVLVAVMLARERRAPAWSVQRRSPRLLRGRASDRCMELAAALATLPSGLLEMVADAVAALGHADAGAPRSSA